MADLVSGRYGQYNPMQVLFGLSNATNPEVPARSNAEYLGWSTLTDGALAGSGVLCAVPIPIDPGTVVTNVSMLVGNTAASTPTHSFAAIYSGIATPALIAQSTDGTTAAIAAGAMFNFVLSSPQTITAAQAPNGYIWAGVSVTATAVNTAVSVTAGTTNAIYQYFTSSTTPKGNSPVGISVTAGSSLGGTAAATIASPAAKAVAPILVLS
jgi:hypothetical protein